MQLRALFDFNELSYCIYSILHSITKYSIKRFIILFLLNYEFEKTNNLFIQ